MADLAFLHAMVKGRVQGVFFRAFVEGWAERLHLTGYVRNRPGGMVDVVAEGEKHNLEQLLDNLKKGPPAARVDEVKVDWAEYTGSFQDFKVRY
jgi:acylphosphatase